MPAASLVFVQISDTHIHPDPAYAGEHDFVPPRYSTQLGAKLLVEQVNALPFTPDFILHSGDVAYDPIPEAYEIAHDILSALKVPVYYVVGNHDDSAAMQEILLGRSPAQLILPYHYQFEAKGVQIAVFDSNGTTDVPRGLITDDQLAFLDRICSADDDRPLVLITHHNPQMDIPWLDDFMGIQNTDAMHAIIKKAAHRLRGVFFGHVHQAVDYVRDGVAYHSAASGWCQFHAYPGMVTTTPNFDSQPGFNLVRITRDSTFVRRYRYPPPG